MSANFKYSKALTLNNLSSLLFITTLIFVLNMNVNAQAPQGIPYQSIIRNFSGELIINQPVTLRYSIHDSTILGTVVYQETHNATTSNLGMVTLTIGQGASNIGSLSSVNWGSSAKFIQVELDVAGGSNYVNLGTQQMMSVPYSLFSANGMKNGTTVGEMLYWNGTSWASVAPTVSLPGNQAKTLKFCNGAPTWEDCPAVAPTVTSTAALSNISNFIASCGGSIVSDGGALVSARGVCWSTSTNPTVSLSTKTIDGSGIGSFSSNITSLTAGTTYYIRAYATNNVGTSYGNQLQFTTVAVPTIGQNYQGGKVAYILQAGDPGYDANVIHGLIAATSDLNLGIQWYNGSYIISGTTGSALGFGYANTNTIVSVQGGGNYAAKICYDLVENGYSDWYLPSLDELNKLYINKASIGGFANDYYWSSTEFDNYDAWIQGFSNGLQVNDGKFNEYYVRAVRAF
jgi:hypothetical protein